jgi:hypothetical protein
MMAVWPRPPPPPPAPAAPPLPPLRGVRATDPPRSPAYTAQHSSGLSVMFVP